jgi:hypothetical protein
VVNPFYGVIYETSPAIIEVYLQDIALPPMWEAFDMWAETVTALVVTPLIVIRAVV